MPIQPYYEEDGITIYHGDCREVLPALSCVDHVITDPPYFRDVYRRMSSIEDGYGNSAKSLKRAGTAIVKMAAGDIGAIDDLVEPIALACAQICRRWAIIFSDVENSHRWRDALTNAGLRYMRTGAWVKPDSMPQMSGDRPAVGFEVCTIAHSRKASRWNGGGRAALWIHNTCRTDRPDHPCPKPLPLMFELVQQFTDPGDLILDPFMGSGTTLLAAKNLGRRAIGIEVNEQYCQIAVQRLRQMTFGFGVPATSKSEQTAFKLSE